MKTIILALTYLISFNAWALDYESLFENNEISICKVSIKPHEEIDLHRDAYPQIVVALKGGTITRLEADGTTTDVVFPTGVAVSRGVDPENELHRSINNSSEPVELIITQLKNVQPKDKNPPINSHDVSVNIQINCPNSDEYAAFLKSIPTKNSDSFEEWKSSFIDNMGQLINLVESEKVFNSCWSVNTHDNQPTDAKVE